MYDDGLNGRSSSSKLGLACGGLLILALASVAVIVVSFIGTNNSLVGLEEGVIASYNDGENVHSNTFKKIKQAGLVTENYSKQVQDTISNAIRGRYGPDGIKANMAFIQEQNPSISPDLFQRLIVIIEAGNNEFAAKQTDRLDRIRVYRTKLRSFPGSFIASTLGFPKIDMAKYEKVISVESSKVTMETGVDAATNPFTDKQ
jgi:hypothetical protein